MEFSDFFDAQNSEDEEPIESEFPSYCEACAETIVHFQHFVELVGKDLLRSEHRLLADKDNIKISNNQGTGVEVTASGNVTVSKFLG